jgi:hypothetical protein
MKFKFLAAVLLAAMSIGCQQSKAKACKGCKGPELEACQIAYEDCAAAPNCREIDLKRRYADDICLYEEEPVQ